MYEIDNFVEENMNKISLHGIFYLEPLSKEQMRKLKEEQKKEKEEEQKQKKEK